MMWRKHIGYIFGNNKILLMTIQFIKVGQEKIKNPKVV